MKVLFVNEAGVRELLPMDSCVALMRDALTALSRGDAVLPLRSKVSLPDQSGLLGLMPGYLGDPQSFGLKVVAVMPGNHGTPYDSHQGVVMLFGVKHGEPLAVMDASSITAIRTAAASAAATDVLARPDAGDLALIGSGAEGRTHLAAMKAVRRLRRVRVWSRTRANAERFAREEGTVAGVPIEVAETAEAAVKGADLICTTTSSKEPVLEGKWLASGAHVNAVGSCFPTARELDTNAVRRARLYTDCRESCLKEAGDFIIPRNEGSIDDGHLIGEVGEVFLERIPGRRSQDEITLYESLGVAVEDLAAAHAIHRRARESGAGTWLEWGGPP
ncbi:MAG TPA: ornithine cyclodeaminase family protein [Candidatus Eisenbacteria bacterium]|nr:ornithine cyclodeaminase family protein [Candidatus Eisenbacteria bacterium]